MVQVLAGVQRCAVLQVLTTSHKRGTWLAVHHACYHSSLPGNAQSACGHQTVTRAETSRCCSMPHRG